MKTTICTLFEGHYHQGVGALGNSLSAAGFRGIMWAGYRGPLPPWASSAVVIDPDMRRLDVEEGFSIIFVHLETPLHFAYFKPEFLARILDEFDPDCDAAIYIDPDIVVKCPWHLLERWPWQGVALVQDVHSVMPPRHPMRLAWWEFLAQRGISADFPRDRYYSSGFVGVPRSQRRFLDVWERVMEIVLSEIGSNKGTKHGAAGEIFHSTDQDALNMALMVADTPVNAAGSESMDFATGGYLLSHAIGTPKPWNGGFLSEAFRGSPPRMASKAFLYYATGPIKFCEPARRAWLVFTLNLSAAIGRFYRRA